MDLKIWMKLGIYGFFAFLRNPIEDMWNWYIWFEFVCEIFPNAKNQY
jgi:hypothetical protein